MCAFVSAGLSMYVGIYARVPASLSRLTDNLQTLQLTSMSCFSQAPTESERIVRDPLARHKANAAVTEPASAAAKSSVAPIKVAE